MSEVNTSNPYYYYIDPNTNYTKTKPHPTNNLIDLYSLNNIANSVARLNNDGTKGVKLRKSYKAHINELPGIKTNFAKDHTISPIVFAPEREGVPIKINQFNENLLSNLLKFEKTNDGGIQGFDINKLGLSDGGSSGSGSGSGSAGGYSNNSGGNGDGGQGTKRRQKSGRSEDDFKRRKMDQ